MGKLAQRLADASRSGVYRVRSTASLEEAAALNGQRVIALVLGDEAFLESLKAEAEKAKKRGECFFAALLDADGRAALPPLYKDEKG